MKIIKYSQENGKNKNQDFISFNFYKDEKLLDSSPFWGITLKNAGSMRFRWNEENKTRDKKLTEIAKITQTEKKACAIEQNHTKIVFQIEKLSDCINKTGDGIVTLNKNLMPVVTVADCVPIYFYDSKTGAFGVVHSGWKGTGIIKNALELCKKNYNSDYSDVCVAIGPHIHSCCYIVNEERALYFKENFSPLCVQKLSFERQKIEEKNWDNKGTSLYSLSLQEANLSILREIGVKEENIVLLDECTSCNQYFGSNRRETKENSLLNLNQNQFTCMAAFVYW